MATTWNDLNPTEHKILEFLASDKTRREIAHELGISIDSLNSQLRRGKSKSALYEKIGVDTDKSAVVWYFKNRRNTPVSSGDYDKALSDYRTVPEVPSEFHCYRFGNFEIPVTILLGSSKSPYRYDQVHVEFTDTFRHEQEDYPPYLAAIKGELLNEQMRIGGFKKINDNVLPRFHKFRHEPETSNDEKGDVHIYLSKTTWDTYVATNRSLDHSIRTPSSGLQWIPTGQTIRERSVHPPYSDLRGSVLANPFSAHIWIISKNPNQDPPEQIIIRKRNPETAFYRGVFQTSAAGFVSMAHKDETGTPNPFVAAVEEARQEVADRLILQPEEFHLLGVSLSWDELVPVFFGYATTDITVEDLIGDLVRDGWEGRRGAIPFTPKAVLEHIANRNHKWESHSAMGAIATLLAHFERKDVEAVAKNLPAKTASDFFDNF